MKGRFIIVCLLVFTCYLVWWSKDFILFWDTVQFTGKHGLWYYKEGLLSGLLPPTMDSGHPPFFGIYQAAVWQLFGLSLAVSSLSMLPFLLLNIYFAAQIGRQFLDDNYWLFPLAMVVCPFYLGHSILISPDILLVTGFLICLYGILAYKRWPIYLGSILLCILSMRGVAIAAALGLFQLCVLYKLDKRPHTWISKLLKLYGPAILVVIAYQLYHWLEASWVGFHEASPWSASFGLVSLTGLVKNIVVFSWRLCDYGMVLGYGVCFYFLIVKRQHHMLSPLFYFLVVVFAILILPFDGLLNHRYFIPIQLVMILVALSFLKPYRIYLSLSLIVLLALGNLIIYPDKLSQGWDVTAAHWPYYKMEKALHNYIVKDPQLTVEEVGTAFPLRVDRQYLNLSNDTSGYHQYDLATDRYILYSNVMNEFTDQEIATLQQKWTIVKAMESRGVKMMLYAK